MSQSVFELVRQALTSIEFHAQHHPLGTQPAAQYKSQVADMLRAAAKGNYQSSQSFLHGVADAIEKGL